MFSSVWSNENFQRKDRSKEFYNISGRMLIEFKGDLIYKVNVFGDEIERYRKENFLKLLTPEEAQKFKKDFIEYFV